MKPIIKKGILVLCKECGYQGIRWNDNFICKQCGGLMDIIAHENMEEII